MPNDIVALDIQSDLNYHLSKRALKQPWISFSEKELISVLIKSIIEFNRDIMIIPILISLFTETPIS